MPGHPSEESMQTASRTAPKAWTADEVRQDASWIQRLSAAEVEGFDLALQHAWHLQARASLAAPAPANLPNTAPRNTEVAPV